MLVLTTLKYQEKKKNKPNTQQRMKGENRIKEKKQAKMLRLWTPALHHNTLKVHFVRFHSVSFSSSVLVLKPVTTSEASKWKKQPKQNTVSREWRVWGTCSPKHLEMLLTSAAYALPYSASKQSFNKMENSLSLLPAFSQALLIVTCTTISETSPNK